MLVESKQLADDIRGKVANGDNFTALAQQYAIQYYNQGDYGYHPRAVLQPQLGSDIPLDYAFTADIGSLSQPLFDAAKQKQVGYWLINVTGRPEPGKVAVQALLLSDNLTAAEVKAKLESGSDSLSNLADQYTQYSLSKEGHGDLGVINETDNSTYTQAFNDYVFNPATATGKWTATVRPSMDGGDAWLVKIIEREDNRKVTDEDGTTLFHRRSATGFPSSRPTLI
jgi:hypothetical protein